VPICSRGAYAVIRPDPPLDKKDSFRDVPSVSSVVHSRKAKQGGTTDRTDDTDDIWWKEKGCEKTGTGLFLRVLPRNLWVFLVKRPVFFGGNLRSGSQQ